MGSSVSFRCKDCDKVHDYLIGTGFLDTNPKELFKENEDNESKIINGVIRDLEVRKEEYDINTSMKTYLCSNCNYIESNRYVCIKSKNNTYIHNYFCPKCDTKMNEINLNKEIKNSEKVKCQYCGSCNIEREYVEIMWD